MHVHTSRTYLDLSIAPSVSVFQSNLVISYKQTTFLCFYFIAQRKRHLSEMSNPEMALVLEKEHLRSAEESDYMVMENLIQRRYDDDGNQERCGLLSVVAEGREYRMGAGRTLRRASAIEGDIQLPGIQKLGCINAV